MRLRSVHLERFGHFAGASLELPERGLTVVHGRNEAGKTTLLEAIRWLLFGGKDNRYAFAFDPQLLAVSARVDIGALRLEMRRTRGRGAGLKGTVPSGDEVDEDWILQKLSRPNRAIFENVFGFSLEGLAQGAKALAQDDVQAAVFGGGLGGTIQPDRILRALESERESLFKEKGSAQPIAQSLKKLEELAKLVAHSTTRIDEWSRRESDLHAKEAAAEEHARALADKQVRLARAKLVEQAIPVARDRALALAELSHLHAPEALPVDAGARHAALLDRRVSLDADLDVEREREAEARAALEALVVDDSVLAREAELQVLAEKLPQAERAAVELPNKRRELAALSENAEARLADLRPEWSLRELREARFHAAALADLHEAISAREELASRQSNHAHAHADANRELAEAESELATLSAPVDPAPLRAWLEGWSGFVAERAELADTQSRIEKHQRKSAALEKKLSALLHGGTDLAAVVGPREEALAELDRERTQLLEARAQVAQSLGAREADLAEVARQLAEVDASARVPTEGDLAGLRAKRDSAFDAVLRAAAEARAELPSLAVAYERLRGAADEAADRMRTHADAVQRRAVRESQRAQYAGDIERLRARLQEHTTAIAALEDRWRAAFRGVEPGPPAAMRAWLAEREVWLSEQQELTALRARAEQLSSSLARFVERAPDRGDLDTAHARAKALVEAEEQRARTANALVARIARDRARLARLDRERSDLAAESAALEARWSAAVAPFGLPAAISTAAARSVVHGLVELRTSLLASEQHLRDTVTALERDLSELEASVRRMEPDCEEPLAHARTLVKRLGAARLVLASRAERQREVAGCERRIEERLESRAKVVRELEALHTLAGVSESAFADVARARARIHELRMAIEAHDRTLDALCVSVTSREQLLGEAAFADPLELRAAVERLTSEIEVLAAASRRLHQEVGAAAELLRAIDGRSAAAEARAALEAERASLRAHVERWSVLALAEKLLRDAIHKFERENQPELLERASQLFARMTLGRYTRVRRRLDKTLSVERAGGAEITVDQLSTGTREQLFLAIRLAYVDQYRKAAEPLPVVLDDVLVNFDAARARATLDALASFGADVQVILFTCHDHVVEIGCAAHAEVREVPMSTG